MLQEFSIFIFLNKSSLTFTFHFYETGQLLYSQNFSYLKINSRLLKINHIDFTLNQNKISRYINTLK